MLTYIKNFFIKPNIQITLSEKLEIYDYVSSNKGLYKKNDFRFMYYNYIYTKKFKSKTCPYMNYLSQMFSQTPDLTLKHQYKKQIIDAGLQYIVFA